MDAKTSYLDPQLQNVAAQISQAFKGSTDALKDFKVTSTNNDATRVAGAFLSAYHQAALINPGKAFKSNGATPPLQLHDSEKIASKGWFDDFVDVLTTVGPLVVTLASKDYKPSQPDDLKSIIGRVPAVRRNDPEWVDFASAWLLTASQTCVQALSGSKEFTDPKAIPELPQPPAGADKGWFDDVMDFVSDAAPIVMPIVLSLI